MKVNTANFLTLISLMFAVAGEAQWSNSNTVNTQITFTSNSSTTPLMVPDLSGGAFILTPEYLDDNHSNLYMQRINSDGYLQWAPQGLLICGQSLGDDGSTNYEIMDAMLDNSGGIIVAWKDVRNGNQAIYAQRISESGEILWTPNGVSVSAAAGAQLRAQITSDGSSGAIITWENGSTNTDIYAQRLDNNGNLLWGLNGVVVCDATNNQYYPKIVTDGSGGALICWSDFRITNNHPLYAQHLSASGLPAWTANGKIISDGFQNNSAIPMMVADGIGGAVLAWADFRANTMGDVFAQHFDSLGNVLWGIAPVVVCNAANYQDRVSLSLSGNGEALITWRDLRSGSFHVFAQRLSTSGVPLWAANGVQYSYSSVDAVNYPKIIDSQDGNAMVTWSETLPTVTATDIFVQKINSAGQKLWGDHGVTVCAAADFQFLPQIMATANHGAIICWRDYRNTTSGSNIYAQRICTDGTINDCTLNAQVFNFESQTAISPNPNTGKFTFKSPQLIDCLIISGILGNEVAKFYPNALSGEVNLTNVGSGIYFIKLYSANDYAVKKVIVR